MPILYSLVWSDQRIYRSQGEYSNNYPHVSVYQLKNDSIVICHLTVTIRSSRDGQESVDGWYSEIDYNM